MERWPQLAVSKRAVKKRRRDAGGDAASYAGQLLRGEQIRSYASHHSGMRHILGLTKGDDLHASRTCGDDCPSSWLGYDAHGPYRLCVHEHYAAESQAANNARKASR